MEPTPAKLRIVERSRRDSLGEGPVWCPQDRALYWVDIIGQKVNRLGLDDGGLADWDCPEMIGWLLPRAQGGFIAGLKSGFHTLTLEPFTLERIHAPEPDRPGNRMNDACVDARGRIWAGTMQMDGQGAGGHLYRLDHDLSVRRVDEGYHIANGPTISGDGTTLYHTDSLLGRVYRFAIGADGELGPRETFLQFPEEWGSPDGMCCDSAGGIWIAHWGAGCISRFLPDGTRERFIELPASQITKCTFAGDNLDRMFVTSAADGVENEPHAGCLFEVETGFTGLPPHTFAA
jgi:sugar lactone lactonase YvrE